ncbi:MAG: hypothetical protein ACYSTF_07730 [Planctomycetota bacterium]
MKDVRKLKVLAFCGHGRTRLLGLVARLFAFAVVLSVLVLMPSGCTSQFGETKAEARRRHIRNDRIRAQALRADVDTLMLWETPTTLVEQRIP